MALVPTSPHRRRYSAYRASARIGACPALSWMMSGAGVYSTCSWDRMSAAMARTLRACSPVNTAGGMNPRTATADQPAPDSRSFISSSRGMRSVPMPVAASPSR